MKNFWPHRSDPKGFSIGKFARKYRKKISCVSSTLSSNQLLDDGYLKTMNDDSQTLEISYVSRKTGHWANRDFSEYKNAA